MVFWFLKGIERQAKANQRRREARRKDQADFEDFEAFRGSYEQYPYDGSTYFDRVQGPGSSGYRPQNDPWVGIGPLDGSVDRQSRQRSRSHTGGASRRGHRRSEGHRRRANSDDGSRDSYVRKRESSSKGPYRSRPDYDESSHDLPIRSAPKKGRSEASSDKEDDKGSNSKDREKSGYVYLSSEEKKVSFTDDTKGSKDEKKHKKKEGESSKPKTTDAKDSKESTKPTKEPEAESSKPKSGILKSSKGSEKGKEKSKAKAKLDNDGDEAREWPKLPPGPFATGVDFRQPTKGSNPPDPLDPVFKPTRGRGQCRGRGRGRGGYPMGDPFSPFGGGYGGMGGMGGRGGFGPPGGFGLPREMNYNDAHEIDEDIRRAKNGETPQEMAERKRKAAQKKKDDEKRRGWG